MLKLYGDEGGFCGFWIMYVSNFIKGIFSLNCWFLIVL